MINNIAYDVILLPEKLTKFPNFTRFPHEKFSISLHNKTTRSRPDRGQNLEAEAEAKILASRPTSLVSVVCLCVVVGVVRSECR